MRSPSGDQYEITGGGYRAVVTEGGAALRVLEHRGQPLVHGFDEAEISTGGRGQLLMPWTNRIRDGRYEIDGTEYQLALSEPSRQNASHGLVRWAPWSMEEHTENSVSLVHRLMGQSGYPWALDLQVVYDLSADGLTVTQTAVNGSDTAAPYACGAHPYLTVGEGPVDSWELTLPASVRLVTDDRLIPIGREDVEGTEHDFRVSRPIRETRFDHAFTDLERDEEGLATVEVRGEGRRVGLWMGAGMDYIQVFSADTPTDPRRALAVEPMTAPGNAFVSGDGLRMLAPAGEPGDELSVTWGVRVLD